VVEARRRKHGVRRQEQVRDAIVVGGRHPAGRHRVRERRVRLDGQGIAGDVVRTQRQRGRQGVPPARLVTAGHPVDQVDPDVVEARRAQPREGGARRGRVVPTAQERQRRVVQRLDSQAGAVEAGRAPGRGRVGRHVAGIDLDRAFGVGGQAGAVVQPRQRGRQHYGRQRGRRAAADVQRREGAARRVRAQGRLAPDAVGPLAGARQARTRRERAVGALADAERHVDVESGRVVHDPVAGREFGRHSAE
jgi:hypothetical protein